MTKLDLQNIDTLITERLRPIVEDISQIKKDIADLRADIAAIRSSFKVKISDLYGVCPKCNQKWVGKCYDPGCLNR